MQRTMAISWALSIGTTLPALLSGQPRTSYVPLGSGADAVLYEPLQMGVKSRIAVIYAHPSGDNFNHPIGRELSARGYSALMVNTYGVRAAFEDYAAPIAAAIVTPARFRGFQR